MTATNARDRATGKDNGTAMQATGSGPPVNAEDSRPRETDACTAATWRTPDCAGQ